MAIHIWTLERLCADLQDGERGPRDEFVLYTDHLAECREREKEAAERAWVACAKWLEDCLGYALRTPKGVWDEFERRYGEGRGKA